MKNQSPAGRPILKQFLKQCLLHMTICSSILFLVIHAQGNNGLYRYTDIFWMAPMALLTSMFCIPSVMFLTILIIDTKYALSILKDWKHIFCRLSYERDQMYKHSHL